MMGRPGLLSAALVLAACHKATPPAAVEEAGTASPGVEAGPESKPVVVPARCRTTDVGFPLDDGRALDDLEIGDALAYPGGLVVDLVHRTAAGRVSALALLPPDGSSVRIRDLGPTLGDAPPPRVTVRGGDLLAASYVLGKKQDSREIAIYAISAAGDVKAAGTVTEQRDDSLAFDVAPGLVVWDETSGSSPRGVIRGAELTADGHAGPPRDVSPTDSDAEAPRVVPSGAGFLVFWIARKVESADAVDASAAVEITGEAPANSWIEVIAVDGHGATVGGARRLTPASGHVSAFDVAPQAGSGARPEVLVVARDDGEAIDGSGGAILRIRVRSDGQDPPVAFSTDGLGRGAPALVDATPPWLAWVALREETRMLPLDAMGAPLALPSGEPELDDGRPLALLAAGSDGTRRLLAAMPADPTAQLRMLACGP
jgi:hypothetical protein